MSERIEGERRAERILGTDTSQLDLLTGDDQ